MCKKSIFEICSWISTKNCIYIWEIIISCWFNSKCDKRCWNRYNEEEEEEEEEEGRDEDGGDDDDDDGGDGGSDDDENDEYDEYDLHDDEDKIDDDQRSRLYIFLIDFYNYYVIYSIL